MISLHLESSQFLKDRGEFYVFIEFITQLYNLKEIENPNLSLFNSNGD